jgi:hypothetical protein
VCEAAFVGESCEFEACPDQCGFTESRGWCEKIDGVYQCVCNQGYIGLDCGLDTKSSLGNSWHLLGRGSQAMQRTAHGGVYLKNLNKFFVFGGFDLNVPLGDLLSFDMSSSKWSNLSSLAHNNESRFNESESIQNDDPLLEVTAPKARYGHAMGALEDGFVLYGGQFVDGSLSDDFFLFQFFKKRMDTFGRPKSSTATSSNSTYSMRGERFVDLYLRWEHGQWGILFQTFPCSGEHFW